MLCNISSKKYIRNLKRREELKNPIFILGAPRSGTTFLASLLEGSSYGVPFETHFITKYFKRLSQYGDFCQQDNFRRLLGDILKERPVMQWGLNIDVDKLYQELGSEFCYGDIVDALCKNYSKSNGCNNWGDKTPTYLLDLDIIYELFPNAKYLYITRDGRDVALSLLQKSWGPNNVFSCAEYWCRYYLDNKTLGTIFSSGRLYEVRYEDLIEDVDQRVGEIYDFIGEESVKEKVSIAVSKVKKGNYYKWKAVMTPMQIKVFNASAHETLRRLGYEVGQDSYKLPAYKKRLYQLHDKLMFAKHLFVMNVIDGFKIRYLGKEPFAD